VSTAFADLLAGGDQFPACALGEGLGADHGEQVVGGVQLMTGVDPPVLATKPLTEEQVGPGQLRAKRRVPQPLGRLGVVPRRRARGPAGQAAGLLEGCSEGSSGSR
jgi:hypothetical protein